MDNFLKYFAMLVNVLLVVLIFTIWVGIICRLLRNRWGSIKETQATVIDKQCYEKRSFFHLQAPSVQREYAITFLTDDKKLVFHVSEATYGNYRVQQKGKLRYRGNRLISFCIV